MTTLGDPEGIFQVTDETICPSIRPRSQMHVVVACLDCFQKILLSGGSVCPRSGGEEIGIQGDGSVEGGICMHPSSTQ